MNRNRMLVMAVALMLVLAPGCSSPPAPDEFDAVQAEIDRARAAEAEVWAPDALRAAEDALAAARAAVAAQDGKWLKSYDEAGELLTTAHTAATRATEGAVSGKARARTDAEATITAAETAMENARTHIRNIPASRLSRGDRSSFRRDLDGLPERLDAARESLVAGDFKASLATATEVESSIASVMDRIETTLDRRPLPPK